MKKKIITFLQKLSEVIFLDASKAAKSALELSYRHFVAQVLEVTPDNLISYGASVYSQNEEDGIIAEIMSRLDITHPTFIEFGVHVSENNTRCMLMNGGKGVWVDAGLSEFKTEVNLQENTRLKVISTFVTLENISFLVDDAIKFLDIAPDQNLDFFSLDLDGNDFYFIEKLLAGGFNPTVFCLEYNPKFPPPMEVKIRYNKDHFWQENNDYYGCSLQCYINLLGSYGYKLLTCNITGSNCFFVKEIYCKNFSLYDPSLLYQPGRDYLSPLFKGKNASLQYIINEIGNG